MPVATSRSARLAALALALSMTGPVAGHAQLFGDPASGPERAAPRSTAQKAAANKTTARKTEGKPPASAKPATPKPAKSPDDQPMRVEIVRSNHADCEPDKCLEWIAAQGRIGPGTPSLFTALIGKLGARRLPIFIDSIGGDVDASLRIARYIRAKGLDVVVTKTIVTPCADSDTACRKRKSGGIASGEPRAVLAKCASACAFILAGGINRLVGTKSIVAVHQIAKFQTITTTRSLYRVTRPLFGAPEKKLVSQEVVGKRTRRTETTAADERMLDKFFDDMGIGFSLMAIIRATPHEKIHIMTDDELHKSRLRTARINGEDIVDQLARTGMYSVKGGAPAPATPVPAPQAAPVPPGGGPMSPRVGTPGLWSCAVDATNCGTRPH